MTQVSRTLIVITAFFVSTVSSLPYFIVQSGRPKCVELDGAVDKTKIRIHYEAPDLDLREDNRPPVYLFIQHHSEAGSKRKPVNMDLKDIKGSIDYDVIGPGEEGEGGVLEVCIRASNAGSKNPMRFAFRMEDLDDIQQPEKAAAVDVDGHLTFFEEQMRHYEGKLRLMLKTQDSMRERDAVYHKKTDSMHQATTFWPIVHIGILLVTGFTQANHIVRFFQKRRLI